MKDTIVLAYSGGLDTSVALRWLADEYAADVIALLVDVGQPIDVEQVDRAGAQGRRGARSSSSTPSRSSRREYVLPIAPGRRALRGPVSAGHGAVAAAHREASGRGRPRGRRDGGGARLHGQGQRPGAVRRRRSTALAPDLKIVAPVREWGMTREEEIAYAARARHPGAGRSRAAPTRIDAEPLGPQRSRRRARGPVGGAARRRLG